MDAASQTYPPDEKATLSDLVACYRLFLFRKPDAQAWSQFSEPIKRGELTLAQLLAKFSTFEVPPMPQSIPMTVAPPVARPASDATDETAPSQAIAEPDTLGLIRGNQFSLVVPVHDVDMMGALERKGVYRPHVVNALQGILKPGMTFVDVGAGYGYFSMMAARAVGDRGRVVSFEADAARCGLISLSADINTMNWIDVRPYAVMHRAATFVHELGGQPSVRALSEADMTDIASRVLVRGVTLREALAVEPHVHVLRIAAGLASAHVVEGARHTMAKHSPIIIAEVQQHTGATPEADAAHTHLLRSLVDAGYRLVLLAGDHQNEPYDRDFKRLLRDATNDGLKRVCVLAYPSSKGSAWAHVRKILNL